MSKGSLRFGYTGHDVGWIAHADVPVAEGVYVTGWKIYRDASGEVKVAPPSIPIEQSDGKLGRKTFVEFTEEGIQSKWLERIKAQFLAWDEEQRKRAEEETGLEGDLPF